MRCKIDEQKANDLMTLLNSLPPGQVKQLLKDRACTEILEKYSMANK